MQTTEHWWMPAEGWQSAPGARPIAAKLVLAFGPVRLLADPAPLEQLRALHPGARLVLCSGTCSLLDTGVHDDRLTAVAIAPERSQIRAAVRSLGGSESTAASTRALVAELTGSGLRHVIVLADGIATDGDALARTLVDALPPGVTASGGLAGDGWEFERTLVGLDEAPAPGRIVAIGLYGEALRVSTAAYGGWETFGPERLVTRARHRVLHQLDGEPALALYERYLGAFAAELPASALLFPLALRLGDDDSGVVRTVIGVDERAGSLTFAGDIPEGAYVRLMKTNVDRLIDGAERAAGLAAREAPATGAELVLVVSCAGRKMVLGERVVEEAEVVREQFGARPAIAGFYSYGELATTAAGSLRLHNQTMTVTAIAEE